jgi:transglutaminase-like putative cysteine protease
VTGAAATLGHGARVGPAPALDAERLWRRRLAVELAAFAGLGALAIVQWARLLADPPAGRLLAALAIACAGAAALALLGRSRLPRPLAGPAALAVALTAVAGAMLAAGIQARLLLPAHWGELGDDLSFGFSGVEQADLPYGGGDEWLRLALVCVAPILVAAAGVISFWPGRKRERRRLVGLVVLLAAYGIAVTLDSPGAELLWGVLLLALIGAWLWAPRIASASAGPAVAALLAAGALALPAGGALAPESPWWDYEGWSWFGSEREVTFDWDHDYGPLDWPQKGTALLEVETPRPLYWKAAVLDRFDGFGWQRAQDNDVFAAREQAARAFVPGQNLPARHEDWMRSASFEIRALSSPFVVGAGATQDVQGLDGASASADGTVRKFAGPVEAGDEYTIESYVPDPTVEQLRAAPPRYPPRLRSQVLLGLPSTGAAAARAADSEAIPGLDPVAGRPMALWGTHDAIAEAAAESSAYAGVYRLARRLTAGAQTPYDAVMAVQRHLHRNYTYNPDVPPAPYPLDAFLFGRREGYCQQFSGAMALMLRLVGIPSRVVAGFAPGSLDNEQNVFTVHDTDAHSWVEVYFREIGWVTFDPTPAASPAVSQSLNELAAIRGINPVDAGARLDVRDRRDGATATAAREAGESEGGGIPWGPVGLTTAGAILLAGGAYAFGAWRRRRAFAAGGAAEAQLDELLAALRRLGWGLPPGATLLAIERRFRTSGRPAVAGYVAGLREHRFARSGPPPPGAAPRRALRRALSGGGGLARRLRALAAIPPGGPRMRARP